MGRTVRPGFTLIEIIVVLALLLILGAIIVPTMAAYEGNSKQRAAADLFYTRLAEARSKAIEQGIPYRVGMMTKNNQTSIRVAPDGDSFDTITADNPPAAGSLATEDAIDSAVTLVINLDQTDDRNTPSSGGWTTISTIKSTGDVRESLPVTVTFNQSNFQPIQIQVRGLTGQARTFRGALPQGAQDQGGMSGGNP